MLSAEHPGIAHLAFQEVLRQNPKKWQAVANIGRCMEGLDRHENALMHYEDALEMAPDNAPALLGMSTSSVNTQRFDESIAYADLVLAKLPDNIQAIVNKAYSLLHKQDYAQGWPLYAQAVGHQQWRERKHHFLDDGEPEPVWAGEGDARIIVTGEQGVGDQIAFCSVIPEMLQQGYQVVGLECYPKLERLFKRTFPRIAVHGSQFKDPPGWRVDHTHVCSMSELLPHFRKKPEDFSGAPYLKVCAEQIQQWRAYFGTRFGSRPRIGVAWNGGSRKTYGWRHKCLPLEAFKPLFSAFPQAVFVSLEYRDPGDLSATPLHDFPWATWQSSDYENTAAMVATLDAVVTVPTSVNHLAGALGIPALCLTSDRPHFHYDMGMPYYNSVNLYRRDDMSTLLSDLGDEIC